MTITMDQVKALRSQTGAGVLDCKKALQETEGEVEKAVEVLRKKGLAAAEKKAGRETAQGAIGSYIHNGRIGVLVELACETDFVATNEVFQGFLRELCMHVCASDPAPIAVGRDEVPEDVIERERTVLADTDEFSGKPENIRDKIIEGKINRFLKERCLLEQPWFKNPDDTVGDVLKGMIGKVGENLVIRRFVRWSMGS